MNLMPDAHHTRIAMEFMKPPSALGAKKKAGTPDIKSMTFERFHSSPQGKDLMGRIMQEFSSVKKGGGNLSD